MSRNKLVWAASALLFLSSCSTSDKRTTQPSQPPECKSHNENHVLTKVGRTIFWLEIKLLEQKKKASSQCEASN